MPVLKNVIIFLLFLSIFSGSKLSAEISFEEILDDPANLELNLKYAK